MTDLTIADIAARLGQEGRSIFLGYGSQGEPTFGHREDHAAVIGPPRCGKSSAIFSPSVACHPGPVIVTSTRASGHHPDIRDATFRARREVAAAHGGIVCELPVDDFITPVVTAVHWDVTDGCADWNTALERARSLAGAAIPLSQDNALAWRNSTTSLLAPVLHMAALGGLTQEEMLGYLRFADTTAVADELESIDINGVRSYLSDAYGYTHASVGFCDDILMATPEVRDNVRYLVRTDVLGFMAYDTAVPTTRFDIDAFLSGWSTLYITLRPQRAEQNRAQISALVDAMCSAVQAKTSANTRTGTLLLALDEVVTVAPVATLPATIATGGGSGIQCLLGLQRPSQARTCWGEEAVQTVVLNPSQTIVFPGVTDRVFLDDLAALFGQESHYDFQVEVAKDAPVRARTADAARLISERLLLERQLASSPDSGRHRAQAERRIARDLLIDRHRHQIRPLNDSLPDIIAELRRYTTAEPRNVRRPVLEGSAIFATPEGTIFLKSRDRRSGAPTFAFNTSQGWWIDPFWSGVLS